MLKTKIKKKTRYLFFTALVAIMILSALMVGTGTIVHAYHFYNISYAAIAADFTHNPGDFNGDHTLAKVNNDSNHWQGSFYLYSTTNTSSNWEYQFKVKIHANHDNESNQSDRYISKGDEIYKGSSYDGYSLTYDKNNDKVRVDGSTSGYKKVTFEFWGNYGNDNKLNVRQEAVSTLSATNISATTTLLPGASTSLSSTISGGSGTYGSKAYTVTKKSGDSNASVPTISNNTFTAPVVTEDTVYTVSYTASDSYCTNLSVTKSVDITVKPYEFYLTGSMNNWNTSSNDYKFTNNGDGTFSIVTLLTNNNEFKLHGGTNNNNWYGASGGQILSITSSNFSDNLSVASPGKNFKWTGTTGKYKLTYTPTNRDSGSLSITYAPYTVTLDANGGSGGTASVTATYGSAMPSATMPTRTGYTFAGYYDTSASSGGTMYYKANGSSNGSWDKVNDAILYARWTPNTYTITYKDEGNAAFTGTHEPGYPTTHTYGTATQLDSPTRSGYNFLGWFTSSNCSGTAITQLSATGYTANITLYAKWENAGVCGFAPAKTSTTMNIGASEDIAVNPNEYHSSGTISVSSGNNNIATATYNASTGNVTITGAGYGSTTITISCTDNNSNSATINVSVNQPTITVTPMNMTIGQDSTVTPTLTNPSSTGSGWTVTYSSSDTSKVSVNGSTLSAKATGTVTITAYYKYNNTTKAQTTFTVAVAKSDLAITNNDPSVNRSYFLTGDHNDILPVTSTPTITSKTWQSSNTSVFTVASDGTITAVAAGNATLTVTATFANGGVDTATVSIYVQNPTLTVDKNSLSLDYISDTTNAGSDYKNTDTFTVSTNANNTAYADHTDITVTSSDTSVVTVNKGSITGTSSSDRTVTATSHAVGTATITVKYYLHNTELTSLRKTISVTVSEYDFNMTLYVMANNNQSSDKWSTAYFIPHTSTSTSSQVSGGVQMVKIGTGLNSEPVFALTVTKKQYTGGFVIGQDNKTRVSGKRNTGRVLVTDVSKNLITITDNSAYWYGSTTAQTAITLNKPIISSKIDETVKVYKTKVATAPTISNGVTPSKYLWTSADTSKASFTANTDTSTPTITGGNTITTTTATVRAFIPLVNTNFEFSSIESSSSSAYQYIASDEKQFTIDIQEALYTITVKAYSKSSSGGSYAENASAMTNCTCTYTGGSGFTGIPAGKDVTLTATPASGYKLVGYYSAGASGGTTYTNGVISNIQDDMTVYVRFDRKYTITYTVNYASYLSTNPFSSNSYTQTLWYNESPGNKNPALQNGFWLNWANSTNLSKYYTEPTNKIGSFTMYAKASGNISDEDKVDTNVTVTIDPYSTWNVRYYIDLHSNCNNEATAALKFCNSSGSTMYYGSSSHTATEFSYVTLQRQGTSTIYSAQIATPYYSADGSTYSNIYAKVRINGGNETKINLGSTMITDIQHEVWLDVVNKEKVSVTRTNTTPNSTNNFQAVASGKTRIYLKQDADMGSGWSDGAKIYYWNDDTQTYPVTWDNSPSMTKLGTDDSGNVYYRYDIDSSANQVIFRNSSGNEQTVDVTLKGTNYFYMTKNGSNSKEHSVEALEKVAIPSVTNAPTAVTAPLLEEDGNNASFSVTPISYTGSAVTYSSSNTDRVDVGSDGKATAQSDGNDAAITVKVKSAVAEAITSEESTKDYFEYSVAVTIIDSSKIDAVKLMSYNSYTSYYCIENYNSTTHAEFLKAPTTALTSTYNSGSAVTRSYTGAGIVTAENTRTGNGVTRYSVKYARCVNNATTYSNISLKVTLSTKADDSGNNSRYGFKEWQENTNPVTKYDKTSSSYKSYKNNGHACVDMTLDLNGNTFTAIYVSYEYVDAVINYIYYDYNTVRDEKDVYYYDVNWANDPSNPRNVNPKDLYTNDVNDYQTSHVEKRYVTEEVEYRSDTNYGNGSDLSNKDFRTIFSGDNYSAQARAIVDDNIKSFQSNYYNYRPYYGTNNDAIEKQSYNSSTYKVVLNVYLYGTPRTYTVSYAGDDLESDENGAPIYYQSWVNLSSNGLRKWFVNGSSTPSAIGNGYRFRVTGDTEVTTQEVTAADAALSGKTVPQHANSTLSGDGTSTQQLTQSFYIQDFFDKTFYKYNDANDNNAEKEYDEITFVGGGVAYYSYNRLAANALPADDTLTNNALVGKNYVHLDSNEGYVASTHTITRNDLYNESTNAYGVNGTATYIGDRIQYLIEKNKTSSEDNEADNLANAYATAISGRQDKDEYNNDAKTGLMYRYLPYEQKYKLNDNGVQVSEEKTNSNTYRYSSQQQAYQFLYRLTMANKESNSTGYMRLYSFMVFSYRDYTFTDEPDGEVKYVLVLSDKYADAPRYYTVSIGNE